MSHAPRKLSSGIRLARGRRAKDIESDMLEVQRHSMEPDEDPQVFFWERVRNTTADGT
jgi:hypothetical protein